ncbi:hypothetical protein VPNG_06005 [Cytospora leucostoma]|uniref:Uncharacterized protein n=1 Tax=Cytospora leucostoma TaxID=1230097 RepID=A0A423XAW2_9PEZI|nr:hypothetical protein VPNG_06005 [Cytospora leucostoma]
MPPKRKQSQSFTHDAVTTGRSKIRRKYGAKAVDQWTPQKVLLYLNKLPQDAAKDWGHGPFQQALDTAAADAVDERMGPNAVIDLHDYTDERERVFGNQAAGELISALLGQIDDDGAGRLACILQEKEIAEVRAAQAEDALAHLQEIVPLDPQDALAFTVTNLETPVHDAGWVYGILWNSALQWMGARLRTMRGYLQHIGASTQEPTDFHNRMRMINIRIHGGNIRADALMCKIDFGADRHKDGNYDIYMRSAFKKIYEMDVDDGYWLAKHGDTASQGVDWGATVGLIDKYIGVRDSVSELSKQPAKYSAGHNAFKAFTTHVSELITLAQTSPDWVASAADLATYAQTRTAVITQCSQWMYKHSNLWTHYAAMTPHWAPADYLRDVWTTKQRAVVKPGGARITLRPQERINYSV